MGKGFLPEAHDRTRTDDHILTKNVLYLLSYVGKLALSRIVYRLAP